MSDSRSDFTESWLTEMPMGIGKMGVSFFHTMLYSLKDYIQHGGNITTLPNGYKKMFGQQVAYYWHETSDTIDLIVELTVKPQALVVNGISKNPKGCTIHATDMYNAILKDNHKSIRLMSDEKLSDQGYALWKRLLSIGHRITVYDKNNPGAPIQTVDSIEDMDNFYKLGDTSATKWQFVLSESNEKLAEARSYFNTYRMRKLSGLL